MLWHSVSKQVRTTTKNDYRLIYRAERPDPGTRPVNITQRIQNIPEFVEIINNHMARIATFEMEWREVNHIK